MRNVSTKFFPKTFPIYNNEHIHKVNQLKDRGKNNIPVLPSRINTSPKSLILTKYFKTNKCALLLGGKAGRGTFK